MSLTLHTDILLISSPNICDTLLSLVTFKSLQWGKGNSSFLVHSAFLPTLLLNRQTKWRCQLCYGGHLLATNWPRACYSGQAIEEPYDFQSLFTWSRMRARIYIKLPVSWACPVPSCPLYFSCPLIAASNSDILLFISIKEPYDISGHKPLKSTKTLNWDSSDERKAIKLFSPPSVRKSAWPCNCHPSVRIRQVMLLQQMTPNITVA